jgi:hypothetical protein
MSDIKSFLKICKSYGYPNQKLLSIADLSGYDIDNFLLDLEGELGNNGVVYFCNKAIEKLSTEDGIRVGIDGLKGDEYCFVKVFPISYDKNEDGNSVISKYRWGKSKILTVDSSQGVNELETKKYCTIEELIDSADIGDWGDLDEFLDDIRTEISVKVFKTCGFTIWFE